VGALERGKGGHDERSREKTPKQKPQPPHPVCGDEPASGLGGEEFRGNKSYVRLGPVTCRSYALPGKKKERRGNPNERILTQRGKETLRTRGDSNVLRKDRWGLRELTEGV